MISMKQIAERCGVSVATVSKALNNHNDIGAATKARICKVADELGYYPNVAARTLKTNRSNNLGVLFADAAHSGLTHDYFAAVLEAFKLEAESRGYDITFINTHTGTGNMSYLEKCRQRSIDGVVIACIGFDRPEVIDLMNSSIPTVTIDYTSNNCTSITSDNLKGIQALTEYIIKKGHRRIAYIHGDSDSAVTKTRMIGFYQTLDRYHITIPENYICPASYLDLNSARMFTERLLDLQKPPTCILYPDDTALIGGLNVIRERNLKIPDDISVAGYDGLRVSRFIAPKLTTIRQDTMEIGSKAATQLINLIEKPKTTMIDRIMVNGTFIAGDSVGEPKY